MGSGIDFYGEYNVKTGRKQNSWKRNPITTLTVLPPTRSFCPQCLSLLAPLLLLFPLPAFMPIYLHYCLVAYYLIPHCI